MGRLLHLLLLLTQQWRQQQQLVVTLLQVGMLQCSYPMHQVFLNCLLHLLAAHRQQQQWLRHRLCSLECRPLCSSRSHALRVVFPI